MTMSERDDPIESLKTWPAERAAGRPNAANEFARFDRAVAEAMTELQTDFAGVREYMQRHERMKLAWSNGCAVLSIYDNTTRAFQADTIRKLQGPLLPDLLRNHIEKMAAEVDKRRDYGRGEIN